MSTRFLVYSRDLPGGGYVAIDAEPSTGPRGDAHRTRLWVERRADPTRRSGHIPPVVAQRSAPTLEHALAELQAIAADNVALALAMRRAARLRRGP